jgi:hypothetical protein
MKRGVGKSLDRVISLRLLMTKLGCSASVLSGPGGNDFLTVIPNQMNFSTLQSFAHVPFPTFGAG